MTAIMQQELKKALAILEAGGLILYPTDTVWGIGCDATNPLAVQKVYALKKREESKALICLVSSFIMLEEVIPEVPLVARELLQEAEKPTTIIYHRPQWVAHNLVAEDNTLAIRVVQHEFCELLIEKFGKPIVSTSANISSQKTAESYQEISREILEGVDYVVNLHQQNQAAQPSAILLLGNDGEVTVLRA